MLIHLIVYVKHMLKTEHLFVNCSSLQRFGNECAPDTNGSILRHSHSVSGPGFGGKKDGASEWVWNKFSYAVWWKVWEERNNIIFRKDKSEW